MTALREVLAAFKIDVDGGKLIELDKRVKGATMNLGSLVKGAQAVAGAFLASAVVTGVRNFASNLANAGDEIDDLSAYLGMSAKALQEWRFAASQNGLSAENLTAAMNRLASSAEAADQGGKRQAKAFKTLGVAFKDAHGDARPLSELLPDVAKGMQKLENPAERNAVALSLFGKQGLRLVPLLAQGEAGMAKYRAELERLGGGFSDELVADAGAYNDELAKLDVSMDSLKSRIGVVLLPALTRLVDWFARGFAAASRIADGIEDLAKNTNLLEAALATASPFLLSWASTALPGLVVGFKAAAAASWTFAKSLLPYVVPALGIAALFLIVQDFITLLQGGESVIGKFFDAFFGAGAAEEAVMGLRYAVHYALGGVKMLIAGVQDLWGWLSHGDTSHLDKALNAFESGKPEAADRSERSKAIKSGDVKGFLANKRPGQSRADALEDFKMSRDNMIRSGEVKANETDAASGLGGKTAYVPKGGQGGMSSTTVNSPINMTVNGGNPEDVKRVVNEALDSRNRAVVAALGQGAR